MIIIINCIKDLKFSKIIDKRGIIMQIKQLLNVLGALNETGRLANDMYQLDKKEYFYKEQDRHISVMEMDIQHLIRVFVKKNCKDIRTVKQKYKVKEFNEHIYKAI